MIFCTFRRQSESARHELERRLHAQHVLGQPRQQVESQERLRVPGFATLFISPLFQRGFVLRFAHANRQAVYRLRQVVLIKLYIF